MTSLRQRMLEDMQVRRLSPFTQRTYVETVARFARYFDRSPARLGPEQIRAYQVYLATERRLATSSVLVAVAALRFLYRVTLQKRWSFDDVIPAPKKPQSLPVVLSPQEVVQFLDAVKAAKHRAILTTCYAAGLRISEAVRLTVSAIDSERMVLRITKGKGQKDRYVMLSPKLLAVLRAWWQVERPRHWLFPGERPEAPITRSAVQIACRIASRRARLVKAVTPHSLRHAFSVHLLEAGTDLRTAAPAAPGEPEPARRARDTGKGNGLVRAGGPTREIHRFMSANQARFRVVAMARVLGVSPSGYYAWRRRPPSARTRADAELRARVQAIHGRSRGTYGAPRIHAELTAAGVVVSRKRVARVMRSVGIAGVSRRRGPRTTRRNAQARPAPDRVERRFEANAPNQLWVADIASIPTLAGFLYLAIVLDVFSRRVVGWAMAGHPRTALRRWRSVLAAGNGASRGRWVRSAVFG